MNMFVELLGEMFTYIFVEVIWEKWLKKANSKKKMKF